MRSRRPLVRRTPVGPVERLSAQDMTQLASDVGPAPWQVGAILRLEGGSEAETATLLDSVGHRLAAVPRLRQVLRRTPVACGRPIWVDDPDLDLREHLRTLPCPPPGDEQALLDLAASLVTERLPFARPLWRATLVTHLAGGDAALVVVFHHVLADGIGGLAILANLVDGAPEPVRVPDPRPAPARVELAKDAARGRVAAAKRWRELVPTLRQAVTELRTGSGLVPATSLNAPTGSRRRLVVARVDLARLRTTAHGRSATVNDVVLTAVAGALGSLLGRRGESVDRLVVSVPVSGRAAEGAGLGNAVGVLAVDLPLDGSPGTRLRRIAATTRAHKGSIRGASAAVLGPLFRGLAAVGAFRWFVNRQRVVNVYETNLRGPDRPLGLAGHRVTDVLPVTALAGNVSLSFAVLSYAGRLSVVVVADPDLHPDLTVLGEELQRELDRLAAASGT